ncbi:MAG: alpha/beta hydrolase [Bacteroidota bacterium]
MKHNTVTSNQGVTHYWISERKKETIVFTHGALMDHQLFSHQTASFKSSYTVLLWDVPAHGRSKPYQNFNLSNSCEELLAILKQEKIETIHFVGQSMGGYIGQIFARKYPKKMKSLTVIGSSPLHPKYFSTIDNFLLAITPFILRWYPYHTLIKTIANQIAQSKSGQQYALETLKRSTKIEISRVMQEVYVGVKSYAHEDALVVPILITFGDKDKTGKVQAYSQKWADSEGRKLVIIPNAAHNANMDQPDFFNTTLSTFLDELVND